uniref:Reactive oxygen species modulator 1 n=1 Tax=Theropithecus gelada TaxID=9565 RepID=A0A8D2EC83_THEGE
MPVAVGPYGQSQPSCFDRVKMGFVMGCAVGMAAGALFGTFSCLSPILVSSSGSECGVES